MSDSLKKYNGINCELVASRVKGRRPLQKEDCINYEVDSDEELEEQVNICIFQLIIICFFFRMLQISQVMKKKSMKKIQMILKMMIKSLLFRMDTYPKKKNWMKMGVFNNCATFLST